MPRTRNAAADLDAIVSNAQIKGDGGVKAWPDESLHEEFQKAAEKLRNDAKNAKQFLQFDPKLAEADAQAGLQLLGIAQEVFQRYQSRKQELGWIDFNDLLTRLIACSPIRRMPICKSG